MKDDIANHNSEITEYQDQLDRLRTEVTQMNVMLSDYVKNIVDAGLASRVTVLGKEVTELKAETGVLRRRLEEAREEKELAESKLKMWGTLNTSSESLNRR